MASLFDANFPYTEDPNSPWYTGPKGMGQAEAQVQTTSPPLPTPSLYNPPPPQQKSNPAGDAVKGIEGQVRNQYIQDVVLGDQSSSQFFGDKFGSLFGSSSPGIGASGPSASSFGGVGLGGAAPAMYGGLAASAGPSAGGAAASGFMGAGSGAAASGLGAGSGAAGGAGAGGGMAAAGPIGLAILAGILAQRQKAGAEPGSSQAKFWESVAPSPLTAIQEGNFIGSIPGIGPWLSPSKTRNTDSGQTFGAFGK